MKRWNEDKTNENVKENNEDKGREIKIKIKIKWKLAKNKSWKENKVKGSRTSTHKENKIKLEWNITNNKRKKNKEKKGKGIPNGEGS